MSSRWPAIFVAATTVAFIQAPADDQIFGFTAESSATQRALETMFDSHVRASNMDAWNKRMSSAPNHVGTPHTKENAEWMAEQFRSWGFDTEIEVFHVLFPTPKVRVVEMLEPTRFTAQLDEPMLEEDATSGLSGQLPPFNAYSADGDVTGELVYVNYGIPSDYEELERHGIDVEGKIVIARYGGSWRGIKPKVAAEHGAIATILFSDPRDDGYGQGDVYPDGPYRMEYGAQRGSVADMPTYPGDPLTPFIGATEDAERLAIAEAPTIMKIPVLPISYANALPLLDAIEGPVAPPSWRGGLPITYHLGPGPAKVRVKLEFDWSLHPAYNVIATMEGSEFPDQWVMRGNHHDAWVFGASDPLSGMVVTLEEARAIGELAKTGWRPKRTIKFAAWDAEEPGLLGSTEWAEHHADEIRQKMVVYINTDGTGRAFNKLARTFAAQMEALRKYRTGGEQNVTVKHVTVNEGGQAIVGNVEHSPGGGRSKKNRATTPRTGRIRSSSARVARQPRSARISGAGPQRSRVGRFAAFTALAAAGRKAGKTACTSTGSTRRNPFRSAESSRTCSGKHGRLLPISRPTGTHNLRYRVQFTPPALVGVCSMECLLAANLAADIVGRPGGGMRVVALWTQSRTTAGRALTRRRELRNFGQSAAEGRAPWPKLRKLRT